MKLGIIGWRGMVGNVLLERMTSEKDFEHWDIELFSTSQAGQSSPEIFNQTFTLLDAHDLDALSACDVLITCQGSGYTQKVHGPLRQKGWNGYFVDASSELRMNPDSVLILDPVNQSVIEQAISDGKKDFIGPNCTVSLLLMAIGGLIQEGHVEWVSTMTYQAASGAGAQNMKELVQQWAFMTNHTEELLNDPAQSALAIDKKVREGYAETTFPQNHFGAPLVGNLLPWIDSAREEGETREEWKAMVEANKIMNLERQLPIDGTCVRIGSLRCHSQGVMLKLTSDIPMNDIEAIVRETTPWTKWVDNNKEATIKNLTPAAVTGTLDIPVGRVRKTKLGNEFLNLFTVGDQLLWGAAEPLRRFLSFIN
ncbi:MAG: aspartate-semialdehyde dehydrogenase [Bdellovibrionaceae bacterium]|nr:aspartate-semialdehyde dehydrogenase [Pseudobdellovibrionaceae bacterium]|tara:strand:+ start:60063 stop:61163 length:1101 start_codon:yes stop_codon:yes gene_type:complete